MATAHSQEARGAARKQAILDATLRVLGRRGPAGVTHRAVAEEAQVPLAATTYYFDSKESLLQEALATLAGREAERLDAAAAAFEPEHWSDQDVARAITSVLVQELGGLAAKFDVYLEASRRSRLSGPVSAWIERFIDLAEAVTGDRERAHALVAAIDGLLMHELATGAGAVDVDALAGRIELLVTALRSRP